ncbi:MAG TPA: FAD-binding oxidoreductase [Gaiellaceae bacterium]|nr:FAD-binding oxidoreductase [Gaiellaceae bacterium]
MTTQPDVVVIGGGLIGLLTAVELAERGTRVAVLEKDDLGFEQSGRSVAAINLPGGEPNPASSLLRVSAEQWSTFEERWGHGIDLNAEGWYIVIADDRDREWLEVERATWQATAGYPGSELLDAAAARERFPQFEGEFVAVDVRHGGHVDALMVINALRQIAQQRDIEIRCGEMVTGFETAGDRITGVKTRGGLLHSQDVVIAAGLWSPDLCRQLGFHIPMQRVRAPAVETGPMPPGTIPGFVRGSTFGAKQNRNGTIRITGGYRYSAMLHDLSLHDFRDVRIWAPALWQNRKDVSFRLDPKGLKLELAAKVATMRAQNGEVVFPQRYEPPADPRDRLYQLAQLARLVPQLGDARVHRSFSGVMDLLPDLQPVLGRIPGAANAYVASGFSGHGYMNGPGACQAIAELITTGTSSIDLHDYRPERLQGPLKMREQIF